MDILLPRIHQVLQVVHRAEAIYKPIKIDTILSAIKEMGAINEIFLIPSDMQPDILMAKIVVKKINDASIANIYYAKNASRAEQRFAIAKETIHIFDAPNEKTAVDGNLEKLLDDLCIDGSDLQTAQIIAESRARLGAIELLVPFEARIVLKGSWIAAKYDIKTIAEAYGVPERVMRRALNDSYNEQIKDVRRICGLPYIE